MSAAGQPPSDHRGAGAAAEPAPARVRGATVGRLSMRWEEHGDGALPVVLVHGIPTHPRLWRYVVPQIVRPGVRCLAWELVGYGWSMDDGLGRDISVARQAEYLAAWLDELNIRRAIFVGHDLGGGIIQRVLVARPELAAGLVLIDCIAYDNWPVLPMRAMQFARAFIARMPAALLRPAFRPGLVVLGHDDRQRGIESVELHWRPYARPIGPRAFARQVASLNQRDTLEIADRLPRLEVPARVVWAERDLLSMASGEQLASDLRAPLVRIAGARHFTPEDHPGVVAGAVNELIAAAETGA